MKETRQIVEQTENAETPVREPLFRRYQIKLRAGIKVGMVPIGRPPVF